MKINKGMRMGVILLTLLLISGASYYFSEIHQTKTTNNQTELSEIANNVGFSMYRNNEGGYVLKILNDNESDLSACSLEIYNNNRFKEGSKSIFFYKDFDVKKKDTKEVEVNVDFDKSQYIRFQGYRGSSSKENKITIEGFISALIVSESK